MNGVMIGIALIMLAQGWDRPVIQESELAAPGAAQPQRNDAENTSGGGATSWDIDSSESDSAGGSAPASGSNTEVTTRWEYDENGQPVARTEIIERKPEEQPERKVEPQQTERPADKPEKPAPGRIATFWFIMPRR